MEDVVSRSISRQRFNMLLMTIFGASAVLLAAIGIYGLMAYSVQQRTQEIGIRLALGATTRDVRRMVIVQGMRLALVGRGDRPRLGVRPRTRDCESAVRRHAARRDGVCRRTGAARGSRLDRRLAPGKARGECRPGQCASVRVDEVTLWVTDAGARSSADRAPAS